MKMLGLAAVSLLTFAACAYAQQTDQDNSHPPNQSTYPQPTHKMSRSEKNETAAAKGQTVDLNTATKKDLAALPGVGPDYAQTIIDARPFKSKEDLLKKKVIPQDTYDSIQDRVTVTEPKKASSPQ
jgi:competence protein ComEA